VTLNIGGQLQTPATTCPGIEPLIPTEQLAGWASQLDSMLWRRQNVLHLLEIEPSFLGRLAHSLITTLTRRK